MKILDERETQKKNKDKKEQGCQELCPLKKWWNFKVVFETNSAGIPEINIWNHSGILLEFHWNIGRYCRRFCPNLPHVFQNYSNEIPLIFWRKEPEFLWNFCGILMKFLWYFLELGWYFDGILVEFRWNSIQKSNAKGLTCGI